MQHNLSYNESVQRGTEDFPVELYHIDERDPRFFMSYHWHLEFEIIRVLAGSFSLTWDEREYLLHTGDMVFLRSGALHGGAPEPGCIYECLVFDHGMLQKRDTAGHVELQQLLSGELETRPISASEAPLLWTRLGDLFDVIPQKHPGTPLIAQGLMMECFGHLLNTEACTSLPTGYRRANRKNEQIKRVLSRIEKDYSEPLSLDDLASEASMSPKYFCTFFQQLTRRTPIDYLNDYRIEQACCLLLSGEHSVTETAFRCGFNDLSYFIRIFRKYKGISPGKYKHSVRSTIQSEASANSARIKSINSRTPSDM